MPLQALASLLALREAQERRAERALAAAADERARAEAEEERRVAAAEAARVALAARRREDTAAEESAVTFRASEALARRQYWARLAGDVEALAAALAAFRRGALEGARLAERTARASVARAHERRAVVEQVIERRAVVHRRMDERRAEAVVDDRRHRGTTGQDDLG